MKIGTKTLLFGNHQFLIHPFFVWLAWVKVYRRLPNWKESICILIHDWGYWGKPNIDGPEGEGHPLWATLWAKKYLDSGNLNGYSYLCAFHSSTIAKRYDTSVSRLCLPDKVGVALMPICLLVLLGKLTGETREYRNCPKYAHAKREKMTDGELYQSLRDYYRENVIPLLKNG